MGFSFTKCNHVSPSMAMRIDNIGIFLGSYYSPETLEPGDKPVKWLVLNLTTEGHKPLLPPALNKCQVFEFNEIVMNVPDGGMPAVQPSFWTEIIQYAKDNEFENILIHCLAGHGRTGSIAAALRIANCDETVAEAVKFVRKNYCNSAIETSNQIGYLSWLAQDVYGKEDDSHLVTGSLERTAPAFIKAPVEEVDPANFDWDDDILKLFE